MIGLEDFVRERCKENPKEEILRRVLHHFGYAGIFEAVYGMYVHAKEMEPIESLPPGEKKRIWEMAQKGPGDKKHKIKISKAIYLTEQLYSNDDNGKNNGNVPVEKQLLQDRR